MERLPKIGRISGKILRYIAYGTAYGAIELGIIGSSGYLRRSQRQAFYKLRADLNEYFTDRQIMDSIYNLEKQGYIHRLPNGYLSLNSKKIRILEYLNITQYLPPKKKWDGIWRIVIFDIPEARRIYRDILRRKLKEADAIQLQKSVWLTPVDIKDLIYYLRNKIGLGKHVQLIEAVNISEQNYFLNRFKLKK